MTSDTGSTSSDRSVLLLADISGYTTFLRNVEAAHPEMLLPGGEVAPAYAVISALLDVVMERLVPPFTLSRIEGDAIFAFAPGDQFAGAAASVTALVRSAYAAFGAQFAKAMRNRHDCDACMRLPSLELKFVLHQGTVVTQRIAGQAVLAGPAVNLAHRLLKNTIVDRIGRRGYLFVTDAAAGLLALAATDGLAHVESYADAGQVQGVVIPLGSATGGAPN